MIGLGRMIKSNGAIFLLRKSFKFKCRRLVLADKPIKYETPVPVVPPVPHVKLFSSTSSSFGSDVTKLTPKDEENIVFVLNNFSREELQETGVISPLLLEEMCNHRNQQGLFLSLGDVLSLPGIDNEAFKKICNSFQSHRNKPSVMFQDPNYLKYFSPTLSQEIMENIGTVTSLEVCLDSVCYASTSRSNQVLAWDYVPLVGTNHDKQSPAQILEQAIHVVPHIPKADIYLIETRISRKISPQYVQILLFIARLQTAIQTLLSSDHLINDGGHSFFHVKDLFVARLFDLRVGGERVSGQRILQQIQDGEFPSQVIISSDLWRRFHRLQSGVQKERFANCLMMTAAFVNYIGPGHNPEGRVDGE